MKSRMLLVAVVTILSSCVLMPDVHSALTDERKAYLTNFLIQDCGSCHGLKLKGGLGTPLRPENLKDKPDIWVKHVIQEGIPGTPMPPWKALLSSDDIDFLIKLLREGAVKGD